MDIYQYEVLPEPFRVQVIHLWRKTIGEYRVPRRTGSPLRDARAKTEAAHSFANQAWERLYKEFIERKGVFHLGNERDNPHEQFKKYLLAADTKDTLEVIAHTFRLISSMHANGRDRAWDYAISEMEIGADMAVEELNSRFREHGLGYQFLGGEIIKVDSQYIHAEAVKPAIALLHEEEFRGASDEFLKAHEHYRTGRYKEAIVDALKAFESTLKTICEERNWIYDPTAQARQLIKIMFEKELIPSSLSSHFTALQSTLESGLPTVRNKTSGHGQGKDPVEIPEYLAAYALQLAAANIVLLVKAHKTAV